MNHWMTHWVNEEWQNVWMMNEPKISWTDEWMKLIYYLRNQWTMSARKDEQMNGRVNCEWKRMNDWMNDRMNKQAYERMTVWLL
jgi:hypothetical protein